MLRLRKDGFTSVAAPYGPTLAPDALPALVTREIVVPQGCAPGHVAQNETSCSYEYPNDKCPPTAAAAVCKTDADCHAVLPSDPKLTCRGVEVSCISGVCGTGKPGGDLCVGREYVGGVSIGLNVETSVAGFALVEVQQVCALVPNASWPRHATMIQTARPVAERKTSCGTGAEQFCADSWQRSLCFAVLEGRCLVDPACR